MYVSEDTQHPYILANITTQADKILETDFTEIIDNFKYNGDGGELKNIKAARGNDQAILKILNKDTTSDPSVISGEIKNYLLDKFPKNIILQNFEYNKLTDKDIKKILDSIKARGRDEQHSSNDFFYIKYKFIDLQDNKKEKDYYFKFKLQELTTQKEKNEINSKLYKESILAINSSLYDDIKNEDKYSTGNNNYLQIKGKDGIVGYFNRDIEDIKSNDFSRDVFGHILNRSYLLFPHNLFNSYDKDASNLYITTNNKLYEIIFAMIFVIFLIIFILFTIDIIYAIFINKDSGNTTYYMSNLVKEKHYYLIIIPIIIIIYCMIHSIIYYNIFF
jgi:hypothetical protein